jgi:hypothetical protein
MRPLGLALPALAVVRPVSRPDLPGRLKGLMIVAD